MRISDWSSDVCSSDLLAARSVEDVAFDDRVAVGQRFLAGADADRLAAVRSQGRARAEIIVIDAVAVIERVAVVADHRERHAGVGLALEMRMVDAVAGAVQRNPDILRAAVRSEEHTSELQSIMRI